MKIQAWEQANDLTETIAETGKKTGIRLHNVNRVLAKENNGNEILWQRNANKKNIFLKFDGQFPMHKLER